MSSAEYQPRAGEDVPPLSQSDATVDGRYTVVTPANDPLADEAGMETTRSDREQRELRKRAFDELVEADRRKQFPDGDRE